MHAVSVLRQAIMHQFGMSAQAVFRHRGTRKNIQ